MRHRDAYGATGVTCLALIVGLAGCGGGGSGDGGGDPDPAPNSLFVDVSASRLPAAIRDRSCMDAVGADFDADGDLDLALAIEGGRNVYLRNDGSGTFADASAAVGMLDNNGDHEDMARADLDRDGDPDLVFAAEDTQVHEVYINTAGVFAGRQLAQTSLANAVAAFDVDGDGDQDLVFAGAGLRLLINDGSGQFTDDGLSRLPTGDLALITQDVVAADVDRDGDLDLLLGNEGQNQLLVNDGNGAFAVDATGRLPTVNDETRLMAVGDVDGDGDLDLYVGNVNQELPAGAASLNFFYLNDGTGRFTAAASSVPSAFRTYGGKLADWDGDGDLDLALANADLRNAAVVPAFALFRNNGAGTFEDATTAAFGTAIHEHGFGVEVGDFNRDGKPDLYLCSRGALTTTQRFGSSDHLLFAR
jgi:hypothetical protein